VIDASRGGPDGGPSLRMAYENWVRHTGPTPAVPLQAYALEAAPPPDSVAIVGAGMAGLYAAMRLQAEGVSVRIFEAEPARVGGRVYTHRFTADPNQYFEAGAMRLPDIAEQKPVFDLIDYLNQINQRADPGSVIELIPYVLYDAAGNDLVLVNQQRGPDGRPMTAKYANAHPTALGFPEEATGGKSAAELLDELFKPWLDELAKDFDKGFAEIVKYDDYSLRAYLAQVAHWPEERINYVEVMTSQTNQFQSSFTELLIESMDFSQAQWKTINNGMDRLPNALAARIGAENITLGARVSAITEPADGGVVVWWDGGRQSATFDKVLMALPPAAVRMIATPRWDPDKTHAIRSLHFEPLYKIGMRFKTRFWENVELPAKGGQSITDLPTRWVVYPSYGIGDRGPGVLLLYSWMTDAAGWLAQPADERIRLALRDLHDLYAGLVDVDALFIEAFDVNWAAQPSTGDAMFFPGQFKDLFNVARRAEGNVHFAGEHLSVHHTWIAGAIDSALTACRQMLGEPDLTLLPASE
jgi:monoamine oxidase